MKPSNNIKAALRYHGGKWQLAPWILAQFTQHRVYVEAYGGGASILLRKPRSYAEDPDKAQELKVQLSLTPYSREEFYDTGFSFSDSDVERARRTVVRSFMGYGSNAIDAPTGFRSDSNRSGSTPARDWERYPARIDMLSKRMQGVVIENKPAIDVIKDHDGPNTLHYVDPPYVKGTRTARDGYMHDMGDDEHRALAAVLKKCEGKVILSAYKSELYQDIFNDPDWHLEVKQAHADGAKPRTECLIINKKAYDAINDGRLL